MGIEAIYRISLSRENSEFAAATSVPVPCCAPVRLFLRPGVLSPGMVDTLALALPVGGCPACGGGI